VTGTGKRKGDRAEIEAANLLHGELGYPIRRKLGAGRLDDEGDLEGFTIQVANWANITDAVRVKPLEAERQRANAGNPFAFTMVRLRGGDYRVVMTAEQATNIIREALS
jgi:hypothetical protein